MAAKSVKVLKFGGTSMGSAEAMKRVIAIVKRPQKDARIAAVVVSAMNGVTDSLVKIATLASQKDLSYKKLLAELERRHIETVKRLVSRNSRARALAEVSDLLKHLESAVLGVSLVRELSPGALDYIMSHGERLSAHILAEVLNDRGVKCEYLNARTIIATDNNFGSAAVDFRATGRAIQKHFKTHKRLQIVTGFIGSTVDNKTTTLGRGGSDYSAAIIGAALGARAIEIWTDVSGVYTADPRKVKDALPIRSMTYNEAVEMSYFGAKVIHPPTMRPAQEKNILILIKNTFAPADPGTVIANEDMRDGTLAKGISSSDDVVMLQVEGIEMRGYPAAAGRIFGALSRAGVNVLLITQASSQHSISFAVVPKDAERAKEAIDREFAAERRARLIDDVQVQRALSIIAVVGESMHHRSGISGRLFGTLGKNGVNIVAIAQGSSELNISVVVAKSDETKALNVIHAAFFFPETKTIHVFLVGTGLIGSTFLSQIAQQRKILKEEHGFDIRIAGIGNSHKMAFDPTGIAPETWKRVLTHSKTKMNLRKFIETMKRTDVPARVFVDCTASEEVAQSYAEILSARISVVTPNKRANSGPYAYFKKLGELAREPGVSFLYETNACAALPIISMLDDLTLSGDKILKIEGILSGTMSSIFNQFAGGRSFSESVAEAKRLGYTEPDPREDLNGMDVARKILILVRKSGYPLELSNIEVESLLSKKARAARSIKAFFETLKKEDAVYERKKHAAQRQGKRIRYVATFENGKASVGLRAFPQIHPFYELSASDNIVLVKTKRYSKTPLLIQGPGAGGDVTAAGVFADILRVARDAA